MRREETDAFTSQLDVKMRHMNQAAMTVSTSFMSSPENSKHVVKRSRHITLMGDYTVDDRLTSLP